jgi:hypothetical protein
MDVPAVHGNVVEWANVVVNGNGNDTHHENGDKESERTQKQAFAPRLWKSFFV